MPPAIATFLPKDFMFNSMPNFFAGSRVGIKVFIPIFLNDLGKECNDSGIRCIGRGIMYRHF
jgi:hypothetical protein